MSCQKMIIPMPLAFPSAPCKCWPSFLDVTCWGPFVLLRVVGSCWAKFETGQTFSHGQQCWELLRPLARTFNKRPARFFLWKRKQSKEKLIKIHLLVWEPIYAGWQVLDYIRESGFRNRKFLLVEPEYPSRNWIWKPTSDWNPDWKSNT